VGYEFRWMAETVFFVFKRLFGESVMVKRFPNMTWRMLLELFL
jgi:hypothetical protein